MAIQRCLGSIGSGVRIAPPRRHGDAIAYRNVHIIGVVDKRGKTRPWLCLLMVRKSVLYTLNKGSIPFLTTVSDKTLVFFVRL